MTGTKKSPVAAGNGRRGPDWLAGKIVRALAFPDRAMNRLDVIARRSAAAARQRQVLLDEVAPARRRAARLTREVTALRCEAAELRRDAAESRQAIEAQLGLLMTLVEDRARDAHSALAAVALQVSALDPPFADPEGPLVSIVVPTWQRARLLGVALDSVLNQTYQRWECLVVDDGSTDDTRKLMSRYLTDPRFRYEPIEHQGAPAARNHALALACGEIVAYLDSDNSWQPSYLARVVAALAAEPEAAWVLSGQVMVDPATGAARVRPDLRSSETLLEGNFADLNAVAHHRSALDEVGAMDPDLPRLSDWDLALRLARLSPPARVFATTGVYATRAPHRISDTVPVNIHSHTIRGRYRGRPLEGLRVLFAEWHYPQVTETYIGALVTGLRTLGAHVEVWSQEDVAVPYTSPVPMRRGTLEDALGAVRPHVAVTHWLHKGAEFREITRAAGVPHVVRTHGFEYVPGVINGLLADPQVLIHTFPHLVDRSFLGHPRVVVAPTCFDDELYGPATGKNPLLVVRVAAGLLTKDLETFLVAAQHCPDHRFVLVLGHVFQAEERTELVIGRRDELNSPAEILVDLPHEKTAELVAEAGIYLHTHGTDHPVGMPMSIAESMATGCWALARDLPGMADYLGRGGALYGGATVGARAEDAARRIHETSSWSRARWDSVAAQSVDMAFQHYANRDVVERMVASWCTRLPLAWAPISR